MVRLIHAHRMADDLEEAALDGLAQQFKVAHPQRFAAFLAKIVLIAVIMQSIHIMYRSNQEIPAIRQERCLDGLVFPGIVVHFQTQSYVETFCLCRTEYLCSILCEG